jgi:sterol desaturase/sphingolipid hydroxylase (fatty acid hydroxylase superfamily)
MFHTVWTAGVFASFALYYIAFEEIHWRSHMGGWLPMWARPAAKHHLMHHAQDSGRFNVFLPIFDWLTGLFQPRTRTSAREARR